MNTRCSYSSPGGRFVSPPHNKNDNDKENGNNNAHHHNGNNSIDKGDVGCGSRSSLSALLCCTTNRWSRGDNLYKQRMHWSTTRTNHFPTCAVQEWHIAYHNWFLIDHCSLWILKPVREAIHLLNTWCDISTHKSYPKLKVDNRYKRLQYMIIIISEV